MASSTLKFMKSVIVLITLMTSALTCWAAQDGVIQTEEALIYEKPDAQSAVIARLGRGQVVRMSERNKERWYKVEIPPSINAPIRFGWVRTEEVVPKSMQSELQKFGISDTGVDNKKAEMDRWIVGFSATIDFFRPKALQDAAQVASKWVGGLGFSGEMGYRMSSEWAVLVRMGNNRFKSVVSDTVTYQASGLYWGIFAERAMIRRPMYHLDLGLGGGMGLSQAASVTNGSVESTSSISWMPLGIARLMNSFDFGSFKMGLGLEYRPMARSNVKLGTNTVMMDLGALSSSLYFGFTF